MAESQQSYAVELASMPEVGDALAKLAETSGMPTVLLTGMQREDWCIWAAHGAARLGLDVGLLRPAQGLYCRDVRRTGRPLVIDDAEEGPYRQHPSYRELGVMSYLGVPFRVADGPILGTVCALDSKPHLGLDSVVPHFELMSRMLAHELQLTHVTRDMLDALARVSETAEARERFLAMVAHDLRSPLASIDATARQLLRAPPTPEVLAASAERVLRGTERMRRMIDDLLDYARGRLGGGIPISRVRIDDVGAFLDSVIDDVMSSRRSCIIERRFDVPRSTDASWDRDRISQAMINVFVNACDHGTANAVVHVTARLTSDRDLVVEVTNDGEIGVDARSSIFDPFCGARDSVGLGLGLFIAKRIVDAHGGSIDVAGREGKTCAALRIPLVPK